MKKVMTNEEKITKINKERKQLLEIVKKSIKDNRECLTDSITELFEKLSLDEKSTKKYQELLKAKMLIEDLINQILEAETVEDVVNIRKKLNYYINKIKKELVNRGFNEQELTNYLSGVSELRGNIAKYVRFLKRNNTLKSIDALNANACLNTEDLNLLKALISKENRYNKTHLNSTNKQTKDRKSVSVINPEPKVLNNNSNAESLNEKSHGFAELNFNYAYPIQNVGSLIEEVKDLIGDVPNECTKYTVEDIIAEVKEETQIHEKPFSEEKSKENNGDILDDDIVAYTYSAKNIERQGYADDWEYVKERIARYRRFYGIQKSYEYKGFTITDLVLFLKNIPIYSHNKKRIGRMMFDSRFYGGGDLAGYIDYLRSKTSIKYALKMIFNKTYFNSLEGEYLNNHELCVDWIIKYCRDMEIGLVYPKTQSYREKTLTLS